MFDAQSLTRTLALQQKSYALLSWVNGEVKARRLTFTRLHGALDASAAAAEWIDRNQGSLPPSVRPEPGELAELAHLFASYLVTSFEVARTARTTGGCGCQLCGYLVWGPRLRARTPTKGDFAIAQKLKLNAVELLATEAGLPLLATEIEAFVGAHAELAKDLSLVTWVRELTRRSEFLGQGVPVLALWREVAWKGGKPDKKFTVSAELVLAAEQRIRQALQGAQP